MSRLLVTILSAGLAAFASATTTSAWAGFVTYEIQLTPDRSPTPVATGTFEVDPAVLPLGICGCGGLKNLSLVYDGVDLSLDFLPSTGSLPFATLVQWDPDRHAMYLTGLEGQLPYPWSYSGHNLELFFEPGGNVVDPDTRLTYRWNCSLHGPGGTCISGDYITGTYVLIGPPVFGTPEPATLALVLFGIALGCSRRPRGPRRS